MFHEKGYLADVKNLGYKSYLISTVNLRPTYNEFETAIFESDWYGHVTNWNPVYEKQYKDLMAAEKEHMEIAKMQPDEFEKLLEAVNEI